MVPPHVARGDTASCGGGEAPHVGGSSSFLELRHHRELADAGPADCLRAERGWAAPAAAAWGAGEGTAHGARREREEAQEPPHGQGKDIVVDQRPRRRSSVRIKAACEGARGAVAEQEERGADGRQERCAKAAPACGEEDWEADPRGSGWGRQVEQLQRMVRRKECAIIDRADKVESLMDASGVQAERQAAARVAL